VDKGDTGTAPSTGSTRRRPLLIHEQDRLLPIECEQESQKLSGHSNNPSLVVFAALSHPFVHGMVGIIVHVQ
jgi:hypothetical protein